VQYWESRSTTDLEVIVRGAVTILGVAVAIDSSICLHWALQ
jgi:hypothetical protein